MILPLSLETGFSIDPRSAAVGHRFFPKARWANLIASSAKGTWVELNDVITVIDGSLWFPIVVKIGF